MSTVAANSGVQTSMANSPSAQSSAVIPETSSSSILDIDPNLLDLLLQITDSDITTCALMNSNEQRSELKPVLSAVTAEDEDALALGRMKAEAARDFNEWKQTKRLIKRLSRHDSAISCCSPPTKRMTATAAAPVRK